MTKKIFKLWNEVRALRREVKSLHKTLDNAERINKHLLSSLHEKTGVTRELRERLRTQSTAVETLERQLQEVNKLADDYRERWIKEGREASVFMFAVPQARVFMNPYCTGAPYTGNQYIDRKIADVTDRMKIHLFDELMERGFIKKYEPTPEETRYELRALRV